MPLESDSKLVIAIASSALFSLEESDAIFQTQGEEEYRKYQRVYEKEHFGRGIAFAFIERLLSFNVSKIDAPVAVVLLSRNDPNTGLRVMNSVRAHNLEISQAAFVKGQKPYRYIKAFCASLFLSTNEQDVREAVSLGYPAGLVQNSFLSQETTDDELRIAFDFDSVLADDALGPVYQEKGFAAFWQSETEDGNLPCDLGPFNRLLLQIATLQRTETVRAQEGSGYRRRLRIALLTARNAPAHEHVVTLVRAWGIDVDEVFFLGGVPKARVLEVFRPHIVFDAQQLQVSAAANVAPCVHVPFSIRNTPEGALQLTDSSSSSPAKIPTDSPASGAGSRTAGNKGCVA